MIKRKSGDSLVVADRLGLDVNDPHDEDKAMSPIILVDIYNQLAINPTTG